MLMPQIKPCIQSIIPCEDVVSPTSAGRDERVYLSAGSRPTAPCQHFFSVSLRAFEQSDKCKRSKQGHQSHWEALPRGEFIKPALTWEYCDAHHSSLDD